MVIASGILFDRGTANTDISWTQYLRKRVPRLILPVWCFLILFFTLEYFIRRYEGRPYPFSGSAMFKSFLLVDSPGIEFIWIIRVFFLVAIVSPGLLKLKNRCAGTSYFPIAILGLYALYEFWLTNLAGAIKTWFAIPTNSELLKDILEVCSEFSRNIIVEKVLFYVLPYGCLFALGMMMSRMNARTVLLIALASLFIFLGLNAEFGGSMTPLQMYKYPPRLYYISYGITVCTFLQVIIDRLYVHFARHFSPQNIVISWIVSFSSSTLWVYLWHDVVLSNLNLLCEVLRLPNKLTLFPFNFVLAIGLSVGMTYIQTKLVTRSITKTRWGQQHAKLLTLLFLK